MVRFLLSSSILFCVTPLSAQDRPLPPRVAAMKMTLPEGFKATLFAGEPDVVQPIAFTFDDRGRLWVAECLSYPNWEADPKKGKDRVVIFEDSDGDGVHDKRTVFASNLQNLSGIQYGFGGVWLCSTPNLLFIPIKEELVGQAFLPAKEKEADKNVRPTKTVPAGPPEIVLDGWSLKAGHNVFNSLTWGPDGWLYGCNGIIATSRVGPPGTPDKDRVPINCGVWRYHPTKKKFEAVAHGTTNPWGLDFDEHGEMFITNCVIDHLWHVVPGGHYQRMYGEDLNPHVYKLMPSICDHKHWGGGSWTSSRRPLPSPQGGGRGAGGEGGDGYKVHSEAGGGHAHVGCMIYLGDNWPERYRGGVFMCNLHGSRINHDILERNGSTYVARHAKDFMLANDPWFRGIALHYGPDGGVFVSDWTDTGECHNYKVADKTNGRIFKITYGNVKPWKGDLAKLSDLELAKLQMQKNEWMVRHARRILQEREGSRKISKEAIEKLGSLADSSHRHPVRSQLCALWTLHAINQLTSEKLLKLFSDNNEHVRAWAVRLVAADSDESWNLLKLAIKDSSPLVRLHIASRIQRWDGLLPMVVGYELLQHPEDSKDPYLPLMYWYLVEHLSPVNVSLLLAARIPLVREYMARRITSSGKELQEFNQVVDTLHERDEPSLQRDILQGIQEGLNGRRQVPMPKAWKDAFPVLLKSPLPEVRERALALAVQFGDERAFNFLRKIVPDRALSLKQRETP